MSDRLRAMRRQKVDYDYLNELFAEFKKDKDSTVFKEKIIPFCNYIANDLYGKITAPYDNDFQEYFSAATIAVYNCLKRRDSTDFDSPNAFFVYMKRSSWFDARNLILSGFEAATKETYQGQFDDTEEYQEGTPIDIRDTTDFKLQLPKITKHYIRLTELYVWEEKVVLRRFYFDFLQGLDRNTDSYTPPYTEFCEELNLLMFRVKELEKTSKIIFKIALMHNMNDDFSVKKFHKIRSKDGEYFDKFFLVLACMDRYPYLMELLSVLGTDKFFEILSIFGGVSVNIPKISDMKKVDREVSTYIEFLNMKTPEEVKSKIAMHSANHNTLGFVNGTTSKINAKLDILLRDAYTK